MTSSTSSRPGAEPPSPAAEFWIAVAGPAISLLLALLFYQARFFSVGYSPILALAEYLALLNFVLAVFNLLPGFPLDGGRVLRAAVWGVTKNFRQATMVAANTGRFFGYAMIFLGLWMLLSGSVFNGIWMAFIGWFLESAAASQIQQTMVKGLLVGHKVSEVMNRDFASLPGETPLAEVVEKHVLAGGRRSFVVSQFGRPAGLLTLSSIREVSRDKWATTTAGEATACSHESRAAAQPATGDEGSVRQALISRHEDLLIESRMELGGERLDLQRVAGELEKIRAKYEDDKVGVHIIGHTASELIHTGQAFLDAKADATHIAETLYNYPTLSDMYRHAGLDLLKWRRKRPRQAKTSAKLRPAARTEMRTSPGPGAGSGTSRTSSTSGPPRRVMKTARMSPPGGSLAGPAALRSRPMLDPHPTHRETVANGLRHHVLEWDGGGRTTLLCLHGFLDLSWGWEPHWTFAKIGGSK